MNTPEGNLSERTEDRLREFRIPMMNHARYFGVFMASHSIPDSILVLHKGTGCKMKGSTHISDLFHESFSQICWTEVSGVDILTDSHAMIEDTVLTNYERRRPGLIALATSSVIELTGFDMRESVELLQPKVGCPLVFVPTSGYEGDMYDGLADFTRALAGFVDWTLEPEPGTVNIFGYPFERYEMDHGANIRELKRLVEAIGLHPGAWFLSGQRAGQLLSAHKGAVNSVLPYFNKYRKELEETSGRPALAGDLPMGIAGTTKWLNNIAAAAGADPDKTGTFIKNETARVRILLDIAKRFLGESTACIIQPTPLAAGCAALALELGMDLKNIVLLDSSLGGADEFLRALSRLTAENSPDDLNILENPSWDKVAGLPEFHEDKNKRLPAIIISPTIEMKKQLIFELNIVELGSPSYYKHMIYPAPCLGYEGTVALTQRIMNAASFRH